MLSLPNIFVYNKNRKTRKEGSHMPANKVRFAICGTTYTISTTDSEEYVLSLAEKLDGDMNQMMAASRTASVATAAIITALGYLDELKKSTTGADNMRAQIRDCLLYTSISQIRSRSCSNTICIPPNISGVTGTRHPFFPEYIYFISCFPMGVKHYFEGLFFSSGCGMLKRETRRKAGF